MKRFSDMAAEVTRSTGGGAPREAVEPPPRQSQPNRHPLGCYADGCLLGGAISEGTRGEGPWFCAHHFFAGKNDRDDVTIRLRNRMAAGLPLDEPQGTSQTVLAFRDLMRAAVRPVGGA